MNARMTKRPTPEQMATWVIATATMFGASVPLAHEVAAIFVRAVLAEWAQRDIEEAAT
jgi:hypothetical protein